MATVGTSIETGDALLRPRTEPVEEAAPRRILGRASIAGAGSIYQQCIAFVSGLIVARALGAADYGIFNLARNLVDTTSILTRMGLEIGLQRFFGETRLAAAEALRLRVLRQLRLLAALLALVPIVAVAVGLGGVLETRVYNHPGLAQILLVLALALPFVTDIAVLGGAYRGKLRPAPAILAECVLMPTARLLVIVLLLLAGWQLWAVAAGTTAGAVLTSAWLALRSKRDFPAVPALHESWIEARRVVRYSSVMAMAVLVTTLTSTMDILTLGRYVSAQELGQYSLAKMLLVLIGFFSAAFNQGLGALVADRYAQRDHRGMLRVMSLTTTWIALGTLPVFAVLLLWGSEIALLFGPSFAIAPVVMGWLAAGQFVLALCGCMGWTLSMTNRHMLELAILVGGLVVAVVLCFTLIPRHGQLGAAWATFFALTAVNVTRMMFARQVMRGLPFNAGLLLMIAAGLALAWGARLLASNFELNMLWKSIAGIGMFTVAYALVCWWYLRGTQLRGRANAVT